MLCAVACLSASLVLSNVTDMVECVRHERNGVGFDITATVTFPYDGIRKNISIRDDNGSASLLVWGSVTNDVAVAIGDRVRLTGHVRPSGLYNLTAPVCTGITVLAHGTQPAPIAVSAKDVLDGTCQDRLISICGTVIDSFRDDIDTRMFFLVLDCNRATICVVIASDSDLSAPLRQLHNAEIRVTGICSSGHTNSYRHLSGYLVFAYDMASLTVVRKPSDLFDAPELTPNHIHGPADVQRLGRQRVTGKVVAVSQRSHVLVRHASNSLIDVYLADGEPPPDCGRVVEAIGFAETDYYHLNLTHGLWRPATNRIETAERPPAPISAQDILTDGRGKLKVNPLYHGRTISLVGTVKDLGPADRQDGTFEIDNDGFPVRVDASATPSAITRLVPGCMVSATGICLINIEAKPSRSPFPRATGFTLVLRTPCDLTVIASPPWWTTGRLMVTLGVILAFLVVIVIWNRILSKLVEQRSRQLIKEEVAHAKTDLRAEERARLSVELHDTIAQNLTGIALQLDSVQLASEREPAALPKCIEIVRRSLNSCRQNLRLCLRDLRSQVYEEKSLSDAIAKTLAPHTGNAAVTIDCPLRMQNSSENAVHAILCIIRELVINATRHGKATKISITGRKDASGLSLDIRDNGHGFSPQTAPGIAEGHFGLQGVRERIRHLQGTFELTSQPGAGTVVRIRRLHTDL